MRVLLAAFLALTLYSAAPKPALAVEDVPGYDLMGFPPGEPGDLERGLLDAILTSYPQKKKAFQDEAAKAKGNPQETAAFAQRWRGQAALLGQQFQTALRQPVPFPNAGSVSTIHGDDGSITSHGMVSDFEEAMTLFVGNRKPPEKQAEIRKTISDGNDALAHPTIASVFLHIPEAEVRGYVLNKVKEARDKSAQGIQDYLNLPQVKEALAAVAPPVPPATAEQPVDADTLARLQREAEQDPKCVGIKDPAEQHKCISDVMDRLRQEATHKPPVVAAPPVSGLSTRPQIGLQPAPTPGLPADNGFEISAPPSPSLEPAAPHSTSGLLFGAAKPYLPAAAGAILGAVLGALFLGPLGLGVFLGAVVGAAALGVAGYFVGQKLFGSSN